MNRDEISSEKIESIDLLPKDANPPSSLEENTILMIRKKGLLNNKKSILFRPIGWVTRAAAAVLLFMAGYYTHYFGSSQVQPEYSYMFLLHENDNFLADNSGNTYNEYALWARKVSQSGIELTGDRLGKDYYMVGEASFIESSDRITGFMVVGSTSLDEALKIAAESPHVKYGGTIEVRPIDPH